MMQVNYTCVKSDSSRPRLSLFFVGWRTDFMTTRPKGFGVVRPACWCLLKGRCVCAADILFRPFVDGDAIGRSAGACLRVMCWSELAGAGGLLRRMPRDIVDGAAGLLLAIGIVCYGMQITRTLSHLLRNCGVFDVSGRIVWSGPLFPSKSVHTFPSATCLFRPTTHLYLTHHIHYLHSNNIKNSRLLLLHSPSLLWRCLHLLPFHEGL